MKEIGGEFSLGKKRVPKEVGEGTGKTSEDADEVGFEGLDGALGDVTAMDVWRH